jgi:hypothetical protein
MLGPGHLGYVHSIQKSAAFSGPRNRWYDFGHFLVSVSGNSRAEGAPSLLPYRALFFSGGLSAPPRLRGATVYSFVYLFVYLFCYILIDSNFCESRVAIFVRTVPFFSPLHTVFLPPHTQNLLTRTKKLPTHTKNSFSP